MTAPKQREMRIQVLGKVSAVLDLLYEEPRDLRLVDVERRLGLSRSTTFRLLGSMEDQGFIDRDPGTGAYRLGLRLLQLGMAVSRRLDLRVIAAPTLAALTAQTGQTSFLTIQRHFEAVCIDRVPGSHVDVLALTLGGALPLHIGAAPRVLLAAMDDDQVGAYLVAAASLLPPSTPDDIRRDISQVRARGYAISREDVSKGVCALGAPIVDGNQRVVAAVSISDVVPNYGEPELPALVAHVKQAAAAISARLGSAARTDSVH